MFLACVDRWEIADPFPDRFVIGVARFGAVSLQWEFNWTMTACQQYKATATLGDTIFHKPYRMVVDITVACGFKTLKKSSERLRTAV